LLPYGAIESPTKRFKVLSSAKKLQGCLNNFTFRNELSAMAFTIQELGNIDHLIGQWCFLKSPSEIKKELDYDYEIDGQAVTVLEVRPLWRGKPGEISRSPFVKLRYVKSEALWHIYWIRASGKWQAYEPNPVAKNLKKALQVIDDDQYGCFFG
jgi:hypothetical protein